MSEILENGHVVFHRVRKNRFRITLTAEKNGKRKKVTFNKWVPFNTFYLAIGDKVDIQLNPDEFK